MIKMNELKEMRPTVRYQNGEEITLKTIQEAIEGCANNMKIPVAFKGDKVVSGEKKKGNNGMEDCLVMYHPEHEKDYVKFCVRIKKQGVYTFVSVHEYGKSKLIIQDKMIQGASMGAAIGGMLSTGFVGGVMGIAAGSLLKKKISPDQIKVEEEKNYYVCIEDILNEVIS